MKMLGKEMGAIVLVGMVLLVRTAAATKEAGAKGTANKNDFGSLHDFCATASNRPSMAQTQELLMRAEPGETIRSVSASEMLKMDNIGIQHCNWKELDKRNEFCYKKSINDEDLNRYCNARFKELAKFCADNLDKVFHIEINRKLSTELYNQYKDQAKGNVRKLESIKEDLKEYFEAGSSYFDIGSNYYNGDEIQNQCGQFNRQFESIKAILEYNELEFLQIAKAKGLLKQFQVRIFCEALVAKFGEPDPELSYDEI